MRGLLNVVSVGSPAMIAWTAPLTLYWKLLPGRSVMDNVFQASGKTLASVNSFQDPVIELYARKPTNESVPSLLVKPRMGKSRGSGVLGGSLTTTHMSVRRAPLAAFSQLAGM